MQMEKYLYSDSFSYCYFILNEETHVVIKIQIKPLGGVLKTGGLLGEGENIKRWSQCTIA